MPAARTCWLAETVRTTLTPTVVLKDGKPFLAIGTPGGDSQDQQILLVLLNIIDFGMDVQAAIEAPRVNSLHPQSSFDDHRAQPGVLEVERTLAPQVIEELRVPRARAPAPRRLRHLYRHRGCRDRSRDRTVARRSRSPPRTRADRLLIPASLMDIPFVRRPSTTGSTCWCTRTATARSWRSTSGTTSARRTRSPGAPASRTCSST